MEKMIEKIIANSFYEPYFAVEFHFYDKKKASMICKDAKNLLKELNKKLNIGDCSNV